MPFEALICVRVFCSGSVVCALNLSALSLLCVRADCANGTVRNVLPKQDTPRTVAPSCLGETTQTYPRTFHVTQMRALASTVPTVRLSGATLRAMKLHLYGRNAVIKLETAHG